MIRAEAAALVVLLATSPIVGSEEALDEEFLAFLAEEATEVDQTGNVAPELLAWLDEWWKPATTSADVPGEEKQ